MLKSLAEIAIEAGLVSKDQVVAAAAHADARGEPLVCALVRDLGVDELRLVTLVGRQTRIPVLDPRDTGADVDAVRALPQGVAMRLRVLPLALFEDERGRRLRIAMADPTDAAAICEVEQASGCDVEVCALPLSAVEELAGRAYRGITTVVAPRSRQTGRFNVGQLVENLDEVTDAAIRIDPRTGIRLRALIQVLMQKGLVREDELEAAMNEASDVHKPGQDPDA